MNLRKTMITMLTVSIIAASAVIYTYATQNKNQTDIEKMAIEFLANGPTFGFDGIPESVAVLEEYSMESYPVQHIVVIAFNTFHAGWGDREGTFIAQIVTPHVVRITIVEGEVVEALIDDTWDEVNQKQVIPEELLLVEDARDKAIQHILENYPELGLEAPEDWIAETQTPSGLVGASTTRYLSEGWNVTLSYPVVQYPDFEVRIQFSGEPSFVWSGTVHNTGIVSENSMTQ